MTHPHFRIIDLPGHQVLLATIKKKKDMTNKKTEYQITIGYRAVVTVNVKCDSEEEAKKRALEKFKDYLHFGPSSNIEHDSYAVQGCLNMTETWNMVDA